MQLICLTTLNSEDSQFLRLSAQFFYHLSALSPSLRPLIMACRAFPSLVRLMSRQSSENGRSDEKVAAVSRRQIHAVVAVLNLCFKCVVVGRLVRNGLHEAGVIFCNTFTAYFRSVLPKTLGVNETLSYSITSENSGSCLFVHVKC